MARFDLSPLAKADLEDVWTHISENSSFYADKAIDELISKFKLLADNPKIGSFYHNLIIDLHLFPYKNYNIYCFQTESGIEIYRVLHSSRNVIQVFDDAIDDIK